MVAGSLEVDINLQHGIVGKGKPEDSAYFHKRDRCTDDAAMGTPHGAVVMPGRSTEEPLAACVHQFYSAVLGLRDIHPIHRWE